MRYCSKMVFMQDSLPPLVRRKVAVKTYGNLASRTDQIQEATGKRIKIKKLSHLHLISYEKEGIAKFWISVKQGRQRKVQWVERSQGRIPEEIIKTVIPENWRLWGLNKELVQRLVGNSVHFTIRSDTITPPATALSPSNSSRPPTRPVLNPSGIESTTNNLLNSS